MTAAPRDELVLHSSSLSQQALSVRVTDQATYIEAAEWLKTLQAFIKQHGDGFRESKEKAAATHRAICAHEHAVIDPAAAAYAELKRRMGLWVEQQKQEAEEANRRARMEADLRHAEEIERQIEEAESRGATTDEIEAIVAQPSPAPVPIAPLVAPVRGIATSERWFGEITDKHAFVKEALSNRVLFPLIEVNQGRLDSLVQSLKNVLNNVPGLKIGRRQAISASRMGRR